MSKTKGIPVPGQPGAFEYTGTDGGRVIVQRDPVTGRYVKGGGSWRISAAYAGRPPIRPQSIARRAMGLLSTSGEWNRRDRAKRTKG